MRRLIGIALAVGCSGDDGGGGGSTLEQDPFDRFVNVTAPVSGAFDCFEPTADPAAVTWLTDTPDPALQGTFPIAGLVEDFQEATPVAGATVSLYGSDEVAGTPDATANSDDDGNVALQGDSCSPLTYKVGATATPAGDTRTTFKAHQIYGFPAGGTIEAATFVSVSDITYQLIPSILGIEVQPGLAIIAGTAYDCTRDPSQDSEDPAGKIEGAQVVVYDADGNIPDTLSVNYFVQDFPSYDQEYTSADGLWVSANVSAGDLTVEMWGNLDGELVLLGATRVRSEADGINIANIFAGYGDGVKYPASCETP